MRDIEKLLVELGYDNKSLLSEEYDSAILGADLSSDKVIYDTDKLVQILAKKNNVTEDEIISSGIMDKEFFTKEDKPVFMNKLNVQDLKIIELIKKIRTK